MSAELFAAFGDSSQRKPPEASAPPKSSSQAASHATGSFTPSGIAPVSHAISQSNKRAFPPLQHSTGNVAGSLQWGVGSNNLDVRLGGSSAADDEEGWGDFEVVKPVSDLHAQPVASPAPGPPPTLGQPNGESVKVQRTRLVRASTLDLMTNTLIDLPGSNALPEAIQSPSWMQRSFEEQQGMVSMVADRKPKPRALNLNSNVLFDADDFDGENGEDEDDFGEFVASPGQPPLDLSSRALYAASTAMEKTPTQTVPALGLNVPNSPYPQAPKSPAFQDRNPFPGLALKTPTEPRPLQDENPETSPVTAWPSVGQGSHNGKRHSGDQWAAFKDLPQDKKPARNTESTHDSWDWDPLETKKSTIDSTPGSQAADDVDSSWAWEPAETQIENSARLENDVAPPMNVPPPSILLSVFPKLFSEASSALFRPIGGQPFTVKNRILSDPKTVEFLKGYLVLATVAARIIAGRRMRWHRDKFLAKGMSISAAGSKGMKLAGVDKAQAMREDREASDLLDLWKENLGRLRSAVAAANSTTKASPQSLKIPELRESMPVHTTKMVPTAPRACVICGLKRDERISQVDYDVDDSFGEYWTDHWGHTVVSQILFHLFIVRYQAGASPERIPLLWGWDKLFVGQCAW
jgi:hypothetical protein